MTDAPKLQWHRIAGLRVGVTEFFIIEQDESGFRAMTVHARGPPTRRSKRRNATVRRSTASAGT
jgi:hypothetical protein